MAGLEFLAADPPLAHLLFVEALAAARPARLEHERSLERLAKILRQSAAVGAEVSEETVRMLAGGLASHLSGESSPEGPSGYPSCTTSSCGTCSPRRWRLCAPRMSDEPPRFDPAGFAELPDKLALSPLAHLIAIEALQAGSAARRLQQASLARLAEILSLGRPERPELPADLEQLLLGGALSVVSRHVEGGRVEQLPEIEAALVECLLIPYLGPGESKRIAA
jgi:hypothetical protein